MGMDSYEQADWTLLLVLVPPGHELKEPALAEKVESRVVLRAGLDGPALGVPRLSPQELRQSEDPEERAVAPLLVMIPLRQEPRVTPLDLIELVARAPCRDLLSVIVVGVRAEQCPCSRATVRRAERCTGACELQTPQYAGHET